MSIGTPAFRPLAPGRIRPRGWLERQLRLQADGLTGKIEDIWPDLGPNSAWLGGSGEDWERGPYYLDGLVPLAHALDDAALKAKAQRWIEAILASQRPDGQFGPATNDDWWPRMVAMKVLIQHAEATGDARVEPFLERHLRLQHATIAARPLQKWAVPRGAENVLAILWLAARRPAPWLDELARALFAQTADWAGYLGERLIDAPARSFDHSNHVVNVAMGVKTPGVSEMAGLGNDGLAEVRRALANLDRLHGQSTGMFSGDEWLAGRSPHHGVELCAVVELMFSLELLAAHYGEAEFGDRLERVAYNALPATLSADMTSHQYHQQPNQVLATIARRDWTYSTDAANTFGLEPHFGCCTANFHQGWPKLATHLWMDDGAGGLAVVAYAPARVEGDGFALEVDTDYPFEETVRVRVVASDGTPRAIRLRLPAWCEAPGLRVGGATTPLERDATGYAVLRRAWRVDDTLELSLPMRLETAPRVAGAVSLHLGPLTMAFSPGEIWQRIPETPGFGDWQVTPRTSWNLAVEFTADTRVVDAKIERRPSGPMPFALQDPPVRARVRARLLPDWDLARNSAAPPPQSPVTTTLPPRMIPLVPYGCARLRIAEFPRCDPQAWDGYDFSALRPRG
ncbi:MAG: glycoside hydrolase family 127 protein [Alphaproteobacteria bacterium]|nr:glycoside hydrolase family 127 protein [Alphaproteobacteria bacterium]